MGFGKKTDFETGRMLDLDKSYFNMIKPAVEDAGLKCIRADEIVHSGLIDVPMYEQLLDADVVVADLSTSNKNAFYELGVRHALRPHTTVVIAEDGIKTPPFDVNHILIRQYHHLGEDIGFAEVMRFRAELTKAIKGVLDQDPRDKKDSPVYRFLDLTPPARAAAVAAAAAAQAAVQAVGAPESASEDSATHRMLMQQVEEAEGRQDFATAKALLGGIINLHKTENPKKPVAPYLIQRLALLTYKSKLPTEEAALEEARALLSSFDPATSNDTETLGLWGSIHKRLWSIRKQDRPMLDEAVRAYERGFFLRNDYYNGINLAFLLNLRASLDDHTTRDSIAAAIADYVRAPGIRREVLDICNAWLANNKEPERPTLSAAPDEKELQAFEAASRDYDKAIEHYRDSKYWVLATKGEALLGLGEEAQAEQALAEALQLGPKDWMRDSTQEQIASLKQLLAHSPLDHIKVG